jgi:hypothetical protein
LAATNAPTIYAAWLQECLGWLVDRPDLLADHGADPLAPRPLFLALRSRRFDAAA